MFFVGFPCTHEFLSKKHLNFGQGLDFLKFSEGNRGQNRENQNKNNENQTNTDQKYRKPDSIFLLKIFLFKKGCIGFARFC